MSSYSQTMKLFKKKQPVNVIAQFTREDVCVNVIESEGKQYCLHFEKRDDLEWFVTAHFELADVPKVKDLFAKVERYLSEN